MSVSVSVSVSVILYAQEGQNMGRKPINLQIMALNQGTTGNHQVASEL